jgi:nicotinamide mononucleotide adenylyltransferase
LQNQPNIDQLTETGVIHGRFQVLHIDHLKYILAGKARCEHLVIGITNPDPLLTKDDIADPERSDPAANPLTFFERYQLIRASLEEANIGQSDFSVTPFPINFPDLYKYYMPLDAVFYLTIYDQWGRKKLDMFKSLGLKTEVMWEKTPDEKGLTGAQVRKLMALDEPWEHLVPPSTARLLKMWRIPDRLRRFKDR